MPKAKERGRTYEAPKEKIIDGKRYRYHKMTLTKRGALKEVKKVRASGYWARVVLWGQFPTSYVVYKRKR